MKKDGLNTKLDSMTYNVTQEKGTSRPLQASIAHISKPDYF